MAFHSTWLIHYLESMTGFLVFKVVSQCLAVTITTWFHLFNSYLCMMPMLFHSLLACCWATLTWCNRCTAGYQFQMFNKLPLLWRLCYISIFCLRYASPNFFRLLAKKLHTLRTLKNKKGSLFQKRECGYQFPNFMCWPRKVKWTSINRWFCKGFQQQSSFWTSNRSL